MDKFAKKREKKHGYFRSALATAPIFAAKTLLGDVPRKTLEETIDRRDFAKLMRKRPPKLRKTVSKAFTGRALRGSMLGGGVGIMTAPMFLKGVQLAGSDKKGDKVKGVGLIAGSGAVYQAMKGIGDGLGVAKSRGLPKAVGARMGASYGLARVALKTPSAVALGLAIASGRKKRKDGKAPTVTQKYLKPVLYSSAVGGIQGVTTSLTDKVMSAPKSLRKNEFLKAITPSKSPFRGLKALRPAAKAGLAAGAFGGLVATAVVDKAVSHLKKKKR